MYWRYTWGVSRRSSVGCIRTSERSTERGGTYKDTPGIPPSTLRERTAGRALSTVCRKRACGSFGVTLIHFKTRQKQYCRLKGPFYHVPANTLRRQFQHIIVT
jgi:hypothetical protein